MIKNDNIRIKDIAKLAGVSVGTVDRVIHKRGKVSNASLEKVMAVLDKADYKPNLLARTLGNNKTYSIVVLIPNPSSDEYWNQSNTGIENFIEEWKQYNVAIQPFYFNLYDKRSFTQAAHNAIETKPDGILAAPVFYKEAVEIFKNLSAGNIPYTFFNNNIPEISPLSFIGQDLYQSGKLAAELLALLCDGPATFTILHIYEDIHDSYHLSEKERGFKDFFKSQPHIDIHTVNISSNSIPDLETQFDQLFGNAHIKGLAATTAKGTSTVAAYLKKKNKRDIKLVGYDLVSENIDFLREGYLQFLIHQNPQKQANLALSYLANHLLFKKETPAHDFLPLEIVSRQNLDSYISSRN